MPTPANPLAKETTTMTHPDQPKKAESDLLTRLDTYRRTRTARGATVEELGLIGEAREALAAQPAPAPAERVMLIPAAEFRAFFDALTPLERADDTFEDYRVSVAAVERLDASVCPVPTPTPPAGAEAGRDSIPHSVRLSLLSSFYDAVGKAFYDLQIGDLGSGETLFITVHKNTWSEQHEADRMRAGDQVVAELGPTVPFAFERQETEFWVGYTLNPLAQAQAEGGE